MGEDLRELQDALEVQASLLGRFYIERGRSDSSASGPSDEIERIIHAFTDGHMRIHKLRVRINDDDINASVRELLTLQGELGDRKTSRLHQKEILHGSLDGLITGMQERIGELLSIESRNVGDSGSES